MIHVYALLDVDAPVPTGTGVGGRSLQLFVGRHAAAVLSVHDEAPQPTADALLEHAGVVESAGRRGAVLPARFGHGLDGLGKVEELLEDPELPAKLDALRGRVEIDVRLVAAEPMRADEGTGSAAGSGSEHLRVLAARQAARASDQAERDGLAAGLRARLEALAEGVVLRPNGSLRVVWHGALLLDRRELPRLKRAVAELAAELEPGHTVLCTGPWPPYNFVDRTAPVGAAARGGTG